MRVPHRAHAPSGVRTAPPAGQRDWSRLLEEAAIQRGHFLLTSGLHSPVYVQVARLLHRPDLATAALATLAERVRDRGIDVVAGPAIGAVIIAYEIARHLGARAVWTERADGQMTLRRSFVVAPGERALVVEDVLTTGGSALEVRDMLAAAGAEVVAIAAVVNRLGTADLAGLSVYALLEIPLPIYPAAACPLCREGIPLTKPGSRVLPIG